MFNRLPATACLLSLFCLVSCSTKVGYHGKYVNDEDIAMIKTDLHTRADVMRLLGSPTVKSSFGAKRWYYMSSKVKSGGVAKDQTDMVHTYILDFSPSGVVKKISYKNKNNMRNISYVSRVTPTSGYSDSVVGQIIGGFGNVTKRDKAQS